MANPVNAAQMRRLLELADIQRLAQDLNIECGIPRAFFVGKESAGKTTIMERLMGGAKLGFQAVGRGTLCPVVYQVRRETSEENGQEEAKGDEYWYKATIQRKNEPAEDVDVNELANKIKEHMQSIAETAKFSKDELTVTLTTNDPSFTSIYIYDLPGLVSTDQEGNDGSVVQGLLDVTKAQLKHLREHDIMVVVMDASDKPSDFILHKPPFNLREHDPDGSRTLYVVAKADNLVTAAEFAPTDPDGCIALRNRVQEWIRILGGSHPTFVPTHHIPPASKETATFAEYKALVAEMNETKQGALVEATKSWQVSDPSKFRFDTFVTELLSHMLRHYEMGRAAVQDALEKKHHELKSSVRALKRFVDSMGHLSFQATLEQIVHAIFDEFQDLYMATYGKDPRGRERYSKLGKTLKEDIQDSPRWPLQAVSTATGGGAGGDAGAGAGVHAGDGSDAAIPDADQEFLIQKVRGHDVKLFTTSMNIDRLITDFRIRATWIEAIPPTDAELKNFTSTDGTSDSRNNDTTVARRASDDARRHLMRQGIEYLRSNISTVLRRAVIPVITTVMDQQFPQFKSNAMFVARLTQGIEAAVDDMLCEVMKLTHSHLDAMLGCINMSFPRWCSKVSEFLYPETADQAQLSSRDRVEKMAAEYDKIAACDRAPFAPPLSWTEDELNAARFAYKRHFAALREFLADSVVRQVRACLPEAVKDKRSETGLFQWFHQHIIDIPLQVAAEADGEWEDVEEPAPPEGRIERRLQEQYGVSASLDEARAVLARQQEELARMEDHLARWGRNGGSRRRRGRR